MSRAKTTLAINIAVIVAAVAVATVITWATGNVTALLVSLAVIVSSGWSIVRTFRRPEEASDVDRLNSMRYLDERDRALAQRAFAIVGVVALLLVVATAFVSFFTEALGARVIAFAQFVILFVTWAAANSYVTRKPR